jgi:hypothetical protein
MFRNLIFLYILLIINPFESSYAQYSPQGKEFGFGFILGDPTGGSAKLWLTRDNALAFNIGKSYFGSPRIGVDYLWHFNAFDSDIANLYAGPGGVLGFGEGRGFWYRNKFVRRGGEAGLGGRAMFGVNVVPRRTPLEIFLEFGVLIAFIPDFGSTADAAIGVRFYP